MLYCSPDDALESITPETLESSNRKSSNRNNNILKLDDTPITSTCSMKAALGRKKTAPPRRRMLNAGSALDIYIEMVEASLPPRQTTIQVPQNCR